jgi:perosamine synthetase
MSERIYYTKPSITEKEVEYATDAARHGWGERCYEYINRFEQGFKQHLTVSHAIATSSCTGAMHMGLAALGVGVGDEVILADINWIATAAPITYLGATPVLVDILPDTWCIDPVQAEAAITPKTKAIIATHIYGNLCDMDALIALGEKYGIPIIEDAAEAIGSIYKGKRAGSIGVFGVFSFHGTKTLTTGEGGMFVTNDGELYETVLTLSNHGRSRQQTKQFYPDMIGFKYKMSNIQAAIGCAQMERIDTLIQRKCEIFSYYAECLQAFDYIYLNPEANGNQNGYWMPTVVFDKKLNITRETLVAAFAKQNIDARVFFYPLSSLPMFTPVANPHSYDVPTRSINLPSYHEMTKRNQDAVIHCIKNIIDENK